jgi:deoxyadenosine/deoxycytidine kinase
MVTRMPPYVVIEGCIGVGKTTMAIELSKRLNANALIEDTSACPFITEFYIDPKSNALETELSFVILHYHQISNAMRNRLFEQTIISDFFFDKDLVFPRVTLERKEDIEIVTQLWKKLREKIPSPDIVVYLDAPTEFLYSRVKRRARAFELPMTFDYLDRLNRAYKEFMQGYDRCELVVLDGTKLDKDSHLDPFERVEQLLKDRLIIGRK